MVDGSEVKVSEVRSLKLQPGCSGVKLQPGCSGVELRIGGMCERGGGVMAAEGAMAAEGVVTASDGTSLRCCSITI